MRTSSKIIIPVFLIFSFLAVCAHAGDLYSANEELDIFGAGHVLAADESQAVSLSPQVAAFYRTAGSDTTNQFYSIATGHVGGNNAYGAASNASNIYVNPFNPGEFTSSDLSADLPDTAVSADAWGGDWDRI